MPLDLLLTSQDSLTTWSFADDESYQEKFRLALNELFEDTNGGQPSCDGDSSNNIIDNPARGEYDRCNSSTDAVCQAEDAALAERFMCSINDFLGGSDARLLDSSCQSLSVYDLATPLVKTISYDVAPNTPASASSNATRENSIGEEISNAATREFQSSFREVMNSFSEIISAGRAFTPEECDKVKRDIVRLRQLRRRMSASEKFGVDFAGFSETAHRPVKADSGRRRVLDLHQQKKQLARILAWDMEGWKHKAFSSGEQPSDTASVDGFYDRRELREYIEQKYGMKRVSDHERSRRPRTHKNMKPSMPLTRIEEDDGIKSPDRYKAPASPRARGRITTRSLEKSRRLSMSPSKARNCSIVAEPSATATIQSQATLMLDAAILRTIRYGSLDNEPKREGTSPSRRRCTSPSDRSPRATTPTDRSRRTATPTDRSRRTTTPTNRSRRTGTPTDRSRRTTTPTERSRRVLSPNERLQRPSTPTDHSHRSTTPAAHRQERSTPSSSRRTTTTKRDQAKNPTTPERQRRSKSPSVPKSRHKRSDSRDETTRTDRTRSKSNARPTALPSVPNLGDNEPFDPTTALRRQRGSSTFQSGRNTSLNPSRSEKKCDASKERREERDLVRPRPEKVPLPSQETVREALEGSISVAKPTDAVAGSGESLSKCYKSYLHISDDSSMRGSQRSCRSAGEPAPSRTTAQSSHLASLTTHLTRTTTGRRRGRSCGRSLHSARSSSVSGRVSRRSSICGRSLGASNRNQRLSQKLNALDTPTGYELSGSHRSPHQSFASSTVSPSAELSESRFDACTTDASAPKTPRRLGSALATTVSDTTAVTNSTAATAVAGNGEFAPYRRRTVRHDLADIIRGSASPVKASTCSVASPAGEEETTKRLNRSSIKMILSPQRRTIRDFLKANQTAASGGTRTVSSSCNQTIG
jgi:hypothetical protein